MLKKLTDIFKFTKIFDNVQENYQTEINIKNEVHNDTDNIVDSNIDKDIGTDEMTEDQLNCNHDWVLYNSAELDLRAKLDQDKVEKQLYRLLEKKMTKSSDPLIDKMIELLIVVRKMPRSKGKCMVCNANVELLYVNHGNHSVMY